MTRMPARLLSATAVINCFTVKNQELDVQAGITRSGFCPSPLFSLPHRHTTPSLPSSRLPFPSTLFSTTNMAAKSDGTAVSLQNDIPPPCLPGLEKRSPQCRPVGKEYSLLDCCWTLCGLLVYFSDGASDLWLAAEYYLMRHYEWFALTLVFIIIPSVVVQVLSFRWFAYDYSDANGSGTAAAAMVAASNAESHFSTKDSDQRGAGRSAAVTGSRSSAESCCRVCVWLFQSVVHVLQLAQVWRYVSA